MNSCLIIAEDIGLTAPGIVYETIIRELVRYMNVSVIAIDRRIGLDLPVSYLSSAKCKKRRYSWRMYRLFMSVLGVNLFDLYWLYRQKKQIKVEDIKRQDIIISFASFHHYKGVMLGEYLAKEYAKRWIIYSVDAIPAPIGWCENDRFYRNTRKLISKYIARCDAFFSANRQMLHYQLEPIAPFDKPSGVVYTPIRSDLVLAPLSRVFRPIFLYTGGIYGPRKKESLLDGFRLLIAEYPEARLIFVGINRPELFDPYKDLIKTGNLEIYGYTHDLNAFYMKSSVLIDINAYFENDVFLSSKIVNYLVIRRPIVSITGLNSPSRNIFTEDPSIIHCEHDALAVYRALKRSLEGKYTDWSQRDKYVRMFSAKNVVRDFVEKIKMLDGK